MYTYLVRNTGVDRVEKQYLYRYTRYLVRTAAVQPSTTAVRTWTEYHIVGLDYNSISHSYDIYFGTKYLVVREAKCVKLSLLKLSPITASRTEPPSRTPTACSRAHHPQFPPLQAALPDHPPPATPTRCPLLQSVAAQTPSPLILLLLSPCQ